LAYIARALPGAGLIALIMIACAPAALPTRFYVLTAVPPAGGAPLTTRDVTVGVGPVVLPGYLDRPQIVTRTGGDEIDLAQFDQWGEPLRSAVPRVLAEDLAARVPTERIILFPWRGTRTVQYQVAVEVLRFEGKPGGEVMLRARWRLLDASGRELALRATAVTEATGGPGYRPLVAALSRALAALSSEIAAAITEASG
jgi:uncharacterized lipoprotein YmbA